MKPSWLFCSRPLHMRILDESTKDSGPLESHRASSRPRDPDMFKATCNKIQKEYRTQNTFLRCAINPRKPPLFGQVTVLILWTRQSFFAMCSKVLKETSRPSNTFLRCATVSKKGHCDLQQVPILCFGTK